MNIREHEPLGRHTTLRTGGPARFFCEATLESEIHQALAFARQRQLRIFVLGGGSNILVSDRGFDGLVIKMATRGIRFARAHAHAVEVIAEAGDEWDELVAQAVKQGLFGLENLSLIPGRVGAAVLGNIGAYGAEVKDVFAWAEAIDWQTVSTRRFTAEECAFRYRHSFFKTPEGKRFIITRAAFRLSTAGQVNTRYRDLRDFFTQRRIAAPTLADLREAVIAIRQRKLPDVARIGTAGSFFKNPVIPRAQFEALTARFPGLPGFEEEAGWIKVPVGWILDKVCGFRGARAGLVGTHPDQALVIINLGGTAAEVEAFANAMAERVRVAVGLEVEWEVEKVGP